MLTDDKMQELIDPAIGDAYDSSEMKRAVSVASMCIHHQPTARPNMSMVNFFSRHMLIHYSFPILEMNDKHDYMPMQVVRLLIGIDESLDLMDEAAKPFARRLPIFDASDLDDYTCSRYLKDLNRHKQLALEQ